MAEGVREQISRIKDQLIEKQLKLNSHHLSKQEVEVWSKDQIRNVERLT